MVKKNKKQKHQETSDKTIHDDGDENNLDLQETVSPPLM